MRQSKAGRARSSMKQNASMLVAAATVVGTMLLAAVASGQPETPPEQPPEQPEEPSDQPAPEDSGAVPELPTPAEMAESQPLPPATTVAPPPSSTPPPQPAPPPAEAPEQEEEEVPATLFNGDKEIVYSGFGGINTRYTRVLGNDSVWVGAEGALLLNHAFSVGIGGGGIANEINPTSDTRLEFTYGGLVLRYHFFSSEVVNFAVGSLIGAGGIAVYDRNKESEDIDWEKVGESVFVFEPDLGLYLNITRWLRVGATGGYRFVSGVDKNDLSNTDVRGATGGGTVQFGWF